MFRTYPKNGDPTRCISYVGFYARPEMLEEFGEMVGNAAQMLADVIRDEDYAVAARSQIAADAGIPDFNIFGRNEPALHHYHNTYREALGMEKLELLDA